jgi:hypothetical protein
VHSEEEPWQVTRYGTIRWLANKDMDVRLFGTDVCVQRIAAGSRSAKYWTMADEIFYVLQGSGHTRQWEVEADIADRYYARVAREPRRVEWRQGDLLYMPQNTIRQHFAVDGPPVLLLNGQNRLFKLLGYDAVRYLEDAPEWEAQASAGVTTTTRAQPTSTVAGQ